MSYNPKIMKYIIPFILLLTFSSVSAQNVVFVVIDGARYSETFGDNTSSNIPYMSELASQGAYLDNMHNEHITKTRNGIPALWTGSWDGSYEITYEGNQTQATYSPSIFEYFRKQNNADASQCFYTLKSLSSLWLQSFHTDYGSDYWPTVISWGNTDTDVLQSALEVIENHHPQLLWVYLADVDHEGHSGDWNSYISSIQTADEIVNTLWTTIQNDPIYKDNTTMFVTNDHGRHDNAHGGFSGHGCSCEGCQQIMFLAIGPNIKENYISTTHHELADAAVTASYILDINPEYATGEIVTEILKSGPNSNNEIENIAITFPQLTVSRNKIDLVLEKPDFITLEVYDMMGRKVEETINNEFVDEVSSFDFIQKYTRGIYIMKLQYGNKIYSEKFHVF